MVVGIYQYAGSVSQKGYNLVIHTAIKAAFQLDEAKLNIGESRLNISHFVLRKDRRHLKLIAEEMAKMKIQIDEVKQLAKQANRQDLLGFFDTIQVHYDTFEKNHKNTLTASEKTNFEFITLGVMNPVITALYEPILKIDKILTDIREEALLDKDRFADATNARIKNLNSFALTIAIIAGILGLIISYFIALNISTPVIHAVDFATKLSKGDFSTRLEIHRKDEIGILITALNLMRDNLKEMIEKIKHSAENLNSSGTELSGISTQMSTDAKETSGLADSVSAATEQMSASLNNVAAAMEESSTNTDMVATAAEEMTATINEIAHNAENASSRTSRAVKQSSNALQKMTELSEAAQAIGQVTETIMEISEQTNLLALNATIEAARAGEAGKGFAVVANEIKELANQTAGATQNIKAQIDSVQLTSASTGQEIAEISKIIDGINDIVGTIATAVEEQSAATKEISTNINHASQGIQEVNVNVNESSSAAFEISNNIHQVKNSANQMADSSGQVQISAENLANMAAEMNEMVDQFKI